MNSRADLTNGVSLWHGPDCEGRVVFRYADGQEVRTTWTQLAGIERLAADLREAYELLLARTQCPHTCAHIPVDVLARIDETLYTTNSAVRNTGSLFRQPLAIAMEHPSEKARS